MPIFNIFLTIKQLIYEKLFQLFSHLNVIDDSMR
jgi:hypothetical protein